MAIVKLHLRNFRKCECCGLMIWPGAGRIPLWTSDVTQYVDYNVVREVPKGTMFGDNEQGIKVVNCQNAEGLETLELYELEDKSDG